MHISPLLAVLLVLLAVVLGLALWQRRGSRVMGPPARTSLGGASSTVSPSAERLMASRLPGPEQTLEDPVLGRLAYEDDGDAWMREEDLTIGEVAVGVWLTAGPEGPDARHREWFTALCTHAAGVDARGREIVTTYVRGRGVSLDGLQAWDVRIGMDGDGRMQGLIFYDVADAHPFRQLAVRSMDKWETLQAAVEGG